MRETFKMLNEEEKHIIVNPADGMTLQARLEADIQKDMDGIAIPWGKGYTAEKVNIYRSPSSTHALLLVGTGPPAATAKFTEAWCGPQALPKGKCTT